MATKAELESLVHQLLDAVEDGREVYEKDLSDDAQSLLNEMRRAVGRKTTKKVRVVVECEIEVESDWDEHYADVTLVVDGEEVELQDVDFAELD